MRPMTIHLAAIVNAMIAGANVANAPTAANAPTSGCPVAAVTEANVTNGVTRGSANRP